jgi:hypothetical protein
MMTLKLFVFRRFYLPGSSIFEPSSVSFCPSQMLTKQAHTCLVPAASKTHLLLMTPSLQMVRMSCPSRKATNLTTVNSWSGEHLPGFRMALMHPWERMRWSCRYTLCSSLGYYVHHIWFVCLISIYFEVRKHPIVDCCQRTLIAIMIIVDRQLRSSSCTITLQIVMRIYFWYFESNGFSDFASVILTRM